jgi:hypothetical protein
MTPEQVTKHVLEAAKAIAGKDVPIETFSDPEIDKRLAYVRYDERSVAVQEHFRVLHSAILVGLRTLLPPSAANTLAARQVEVAYMWIGKAIRDAQIARGGDATHQPARGE